MLNSPKRRTAIVGGGGGRAEGAKGHHGGQQCAEGLADEVEPEVLLRRAQEDEGGPDEAGRVDGCARVLAACGKRLAVLNFPASTHRK